MVMFILIKTLLYLIMNMLQLFVHNEKYGRVNLLFEGVR